jgi:hypothetical protein
MTCWMLNLIKVQQACVGHRRGLRTPPALGGIYILQPVVDGGACPWNLECRDCDKFVISGATCCIGGTNASKWRQQLDRRRHRRLRVPALEPRHGRAREKSWPGSACLTRPSPWTYANPRSTSTGSGPPQAARMIALLRIRLATTMPTTSTTRTPARDSPGPIRTPYRRVSLRPGTGAGAGSDDQAHRLRRPVRGRPETQPERRARSRPRRHLDDWITDAVRGFSHSTTPARIT